MASGDSRRRISDETIRARAAALGLRFADGDGAASDLVERVSVAADDVERMSELGLAGHEPAVTFRAPTAAKE